jgi:hypothetical protein
LSRGRLPRLQVKPNFRTTFENITFYQRAI